MTNTSATGGYLTPDASVMPAEDADLEDIFQEMVVGLTGLPGAMVRPSWPDTIPKQPEPNVNWCGLAVSVSDAPQQPSFKHDPTALGGVGGDIMTLQEQITLLCSFYGPNSRKFATMVRDGVKLNQNNGMLQQGYSIGLQNTGQIVSLPELVNQQWVRRSDLTLIFNRSTTRLYPVNTLIDAPVAVQLG